MAAMLSRCGNFHDPALFQKSFTALNDQRVLSRFCDVVLKVCNTEIYAHSNVLAAASPYFNSFLGVGADSSRTFCQNQPQIIEIHIDSVLSDGDGGYGEAVSKVVDYMYTSHITLTTTLVCQVIEICKIMLMDKLLDFCHEFQRGVNDNVPKDVATCTTGLQEVLNLFNSRAKIIKRANASTETDEILFAKLRSMSSESGYDGISYSSNTELKFNEINAINPSNENVNTVNTASIISQGDIVISSDTITQSSLSVSEVNVSNYFNGEGDQNNIVKVKNEQIRLAVNTNADHDVEVLNLNSESTKDNDLEDISIPAISKQTDDTLFKNLDLSISKEESITENKTQENKLAEVSVTTVANPCHSPENQYVSTSILAKALRGRPRGGGRGKRRGRPPGRPKKVEDPASDHDFDEFMQHIEKDSVDTKEIECPKSIENDKSLFNNSTVTASKPKKDPDYVPVNVKRRLRSPIESKSPRWKSARIRSKPSSLKRDYILYSLTIKKRKPCVSSSPGPELEKTEIKRNRNIVKKNQTDSLQFICQKCDFSTSVLKDYRHHLRSHPETDPRCFLCPKCGFKTTKSREYNSHRQKHMKEELVCFYCEYQASTSFEYDQHMEKHSGKFPYFCTECNSRFINKNRLISHNTRHQLEKPFICVICNAGFKWRHALKNHMITHSATKDHLCDVCGFATAHKSQLKAHYLIHTGQALKCTAQGCHFETTKRQKLKYHMITHTHEKPHQCEICGQRFSLNKNMRRHMLLHTDTRPFACKMCSFTSTRYDKLKDHNFKLHNIGEASVPKKVPIVDLPDPSITCVKSVTLNLDGTFSEDALQTIAQLATSQGVNTTDIGLQQTISIEQPDSSGYPIIARIQYTDIEDDTKLEYITTSTTVPDNS